MAEEEEDGKKISPVRERNSQGSGERPSYQVRERRNKTRLRSRTCGIDQIFKSTKTISAKGTYPESITVPIRNKDVDSMASDAFKREGIPPRREIRVEKKDTTD